MNTETKITYPICVGIDVHKEVLVASVRMVDLEGRVDYELIETTTSSNDVKELAEKLKTLNCFHACMEETGKYSCPVYNILMKNNINVICVNPKYLKQVKGKKNDKNDSKRIADFFAMGMAPASFRVGGVNAELKQLTRERSLLVSDRTKVLNRLNGTLVEAGIRIDKIGNLQTQKMIRLVSEIIKNKNFDAEIDVIKIFPKLDEETHNKYVKALSSYCLNSGQRDRIKVEINELNQIKSSIDVIEKCISKYDKVTKKPRELLLSIPGIGYMSSMIILSEIGDDMSKFPNAKCLTSLFGVCPTSNSSAGKSYSSRVSHAGSYLKTTLVQCAWVAVGRFVSNRYFANLFKIKKVSLGAKKAIIMIARKMLVCIYNMLSKSEAFNPKESDIYKASNKLKCSDRAVYFNEETEVQYTPDQMVKLFIEEHNLKELTKF